MSELFRRARFAPIQENCRLCHRVAFRNSLCSPHYFKNEIDLGRITLAGAPSSPRQRFEVSCMGINGYAPDRRVIVGWTSQADGGTLLALVRHHPRWHSGHVRDLQRDSEVLGAANHDRH